MLKRMKYLESYKGLMDILDIYQIKLKQVEVSMLEQ